MTFKDIGPIEDVNHRPESAYRDDGEPNRGGLFRHTRKDGTTLVANITSHVMPYKGRRACLVMSQDVTAQTISREAVTRQEQQFRQLHDSLQVALWLSAPDRPGLLYVSPAFEPIYGRSCDEFLRDPLLWRKVIVDDDLSAVSRAQELLQSVGESQCEYQILRPDGSRRWVRDRRHNIVSDDGSIVMVGGIFEDVTCATETSIALRQLTQQLEERVSERTKELRFINRELDAFSRTAAHDLKTPLNGILGLTQILRMEYSKSMGAQGDRLAIHIQRSAQSMAVLIDDLMALSHASAHDVEKAEVDLAEIARATVDELRMSDTNREVVVSIHDPMHVKGDAGLIRSLMRNLIGNAWKFTAKQTHAHIQVGCEETDQGWALHFVKDNGVGFDMRSAPQIFEPFRRFHSAQEFAGTGVGLATCKRIVNRHGGSIWINSTPSSGTTVYFSLTRSGLNGQPPAVRKESFFATFESL